MADTPPSHSEGLCGCGCEVSAKFWTVGLSVKIGGISVRSATETRCKALVGFLGGFNLRCSKLWFKNVKGVPRVL